MRHAIANACLNWRRRTCTFLIALMGVSLIVACASSRGNQSDRPWWEMDDTYEKEAPVHQELVTHSIYIKMPDGVKLAADIYMPKNLKPDQKLPVILMQTRYVRAMEFRWPFRAFLDGRFADTIKELVTRDYVWMYVDTRGTGASFGSRPYPYSAAEINDGYDVVEWIVKQPWSDGNVGAWGNSYTGGSALLLASVQHPAVKAIMPRFAMFDAYTEVFFPGGVHLKWLTDTWSKLANALDANRPWDFVGIKAKLAAKGIKPVDSDPKRELLEQAVAEHKKNGDPADIIPGITYRDEALAKYPHATVDTLSPHKHLGRINQSGTAVYCYTGWYDAAFLLSEINLYLNLTTPNKKLTIGPWDHGEFNQISPLSKIKKPRFDTPGETLRFFDRFLKGKNTGIMDEKPVHYYTMGEERWKAADTWPPPDAKTVMFYADAEHRLSPDRPELEDAADTYKVDVSAGTGKDSRWRSLINLEHGMIEYKNRKKADRKLLVYDSEPLEEDTEVTGHPVVRLYVDSTETDGTFFVYLEDVDEKGNVLYVTEGALRALHRKIGTGEQEYITPPIPYHTFKKEDGKPLVPGEVAELRFALYPTSYRFEEGHRIRIAIAGADKDHFEQVTETAPTIRVHRSRTHASAIELPVMNR